MGRVLHLSLHARAGNGPRPFVEIEIAPLGDNAFAGAEGREDDQRVRPAYSLAGIRRVECPHDAAHTLEIGDGGMVFAAAISANGIGFASPR